MKELFRRLARRPSLTLELLAATLFVTLLNLASPLFVIQVLNRYITFGFDGTLITLTTGMLVAVALLFGFRAARTRLAQAVSVEPDEEVAESLYGALSRVKTTALDKTGKAKTQEILSGQQTVQAAYEGSNVTAVMDMPFSFLYILASLILSPMLAIIGLMGMGAMLAAGWLALGATQKPARELQNVTMAQRGQAMAALHGADTVRAFQAGEFLRETWRGQIGRITELRLKVAGNKEIFQSLTQTLMILISVFVYAAGAMQVVDGQLTIGALIGVNILTARAVQNVSRFVQTYVQLTRAGEASREIDQFLSLPEEPRTGTALSEYRGGLEFKDMGLVFPGSSGPLFESLSLRLTPGTVLVVQGYNGSGKTTLARLIVGLLEPSRGEILADGITLRQLAPAWWRRQLIYLPQEPTFLNTSIRQNITMANFGLEEAQLNRIINAADLSRFLFSSPAGLETMVEDMGRYLPLGVRRRLALARGLATDGKLVVLDEPTEALDKDGCKAVYALMNSMAEAGKTIVAFTHDARIVKGAHLLLDLSVKPTPVVKQLRAVKTTAKAATE